MTMGGLKGYLSGLSAEGAVARRYEAEGRPIAARRWRGKWGEIDLIAREGDTVVFVEVKQARTHDEAAGRIGWRQVQRIWAAAQEFLDGEPLRSLTEVRFDLALVDSLGRVEIRQHAFS
jgi:putative endonuclease